MNITRKIRRSWAGVGCLCALVLGALLLHADASRAAESATTKKWSGKWDNKKYKTSGPLTCAATLKDNTTWQAKFTGTGLGKPFGYDATIKVSTQGGRMTLQGTASVDGEAYQWRGYVQGKYLIGSYRSASGNNGSFRLEEGK